MKPGICLAHPIVPTNSLSTRSLSMQIVLCWDDDGHESASKLATSGSGSQFNKAATSLLSVGERKRKKERTKERMRNKLSRYKVVN